MNLLTRVLPAGVRTFPAGGLFTLAVGLALVGLEVAGRQTATDVHDGLAAAALLSVGALVAVRHRRSPLPWVGRLGDRARRALAGLAGLKYEHGIDLRGTPALPRKTPPVVRLVVVLQLVWAAAAAATWAALPNGWRDVGFYTSYVVYLAGLLVLWAALLGATFVGVFVPVAVLDRWLRGWLGETDRRGAELAALVAYFILLSVVAYALPPAPVLGLCLVVAAASGLVYLPTSGEGAAVLWRAAPGGAVYAVPLRRVLAAAAGILALAAFDVLLTACGGRLFAPLPGTTSMPLTTLLGAMAAWSLPGLLLVAGVRLGTGMRHDPARRTPPTARVNGGADRAERTLAARVVTGWGWRVKAAAEAKESGDVGVVVVPQDRSEATEFDPGWPLKVSVADLADGSVRPRLERRDEVQLRRHLFRGLSKLFRRAAPFKGPGGGGFWLAPQWWFIEGMGREDADGSPDDAPKLVGPPYHRAFPSRTRQHAHGVLRATAVDMIFVEDGVGHRKVEKVLRVLLELYDVHGGKRRAEEMHFRGLPKVKVMIHDYEPGNPFESDLYPEPKFDDLSRVRVLHVFRDRGGHEEPVDPPYDFSWTPAPALGVG